MAARALVASLARIALGRRHGLNLEAGSAPWSVRSSAQPVSSLPEGVAGGWEKDWDRRLDSAAPAAARISDSGDRKRSNGFFASAVAITSSSLQEASGTRSETRGGASTK